jgi:hypothetical protein
MTITLDLPKELENELSQEAEQLDLSLPDYALHLLYTRPLIKTPPKTGAELVSYWQSVGVIGMRSDIVDSSAHARKIRAAAQRRGLSSAN